MTLFLIFWYENLKLANITMHKLHVTVQEKAHAAG